MTEKVTSSASHAAYMHVCTYCTIARPFLLWSGNELSST